LGLDGQGEEANWLSLGKAASDAGVTRSAVANALVRMRERWLKLPQLTELRDEIAALLPTHGNVMTPHELAKALLLARGSVEQDESTRVRLGLAVARACVEAEQQREPRFQVFDHTTRLLIATTRALADFANRLGEAADRLAQQDPLLSPTTALRELEEVKPPEGLPPLLPHRLVKLAAAASKNAALSSRSELYPIGMSAVQAIRHSLGALTGPQRLTERELHERVRGRFPLCAPLPSHPELDRVLNEAGLDLIWQAGSGDQEAAYVPQALTLSVGSTTQYHRHATQTVLPSEVSTDVAAARAFEERIAHLLARGGFLALTTTLRGASRVAHELTSRFGLQEVSFDELLLDAMLEQASALGIETTVLLEADRAAPASVDRRNLLRLVSRSAALVKETLLRSEKPLLITEPGLLARYDLMSLVTEMQSAAGRPQHTPAIVLLVPMVQPDAPAIDGVIVPTITAAQWAKAPEAWIENRHRSALA